MVTVPLTPQRAWAEDQVTYFTWSGYDVPDFFPGYVKKYGTNPNLPIFSDEEEAFQKQRAGFFADVAHPCSGRIKRWRETLPNGVSYTTLDLIDNGFYDDTKVYEVPEGHYFMMGDNRDNSTDSRVESAVGYVPLENIVGRAQIIFFSILEGEHAWEVWRWPWAVRWSRLFTIVR